MDLFAQLEVLWELLFFFWFPIMELKGQDLDLLWADIHVRPGESPDSTEKF